MVGREYGDLFFLREKEGLEPVQTLVPIAANCGNKPKMTELRLAYFYRKGALRSFAAPSTKVTNADKTPFGWVSAVGCF